MRAVFVLLLIVLLGNTALQVNGLVHDPHKTHVRPGQDVQINYGQRFDKLEGEVKQVGDRVDRILQSIAHGTAGVEGDIEKLNKSVDALNQNIGEFRERFLQHRRATEGRWR